MNMAETAPAFLEILPVIEDYLKTAKAAGKPMRVHLWDMDHFSSEPAKIIADPGLNALAKKFGSPLYILEDLNSADYNAVLPIYINGDTARVRDIMSRDPRNKAVLEIFEYARTDNADNTQNKTRIYYPDRRLEDLSKILSNLPIDQQNIIKKYDSLAKQEIDTRMSNGSFTGSQQENMIDIPEAIKAKLTPEEIKLFDEAMTSMINQLNDPKGNKGIAERTNKIFDPKHDVQITMYGALHYEEKSDLNESMPGLSIGLLNSKNIKENAETYITAKGASSKDFPDYVYYMDQRRLVKLDTDAAKAEFLGMDLKQFKAWELSTQIPDQIKLPVKNSPIASAAQPIFLATTTVPTSHRSA